jgi:hypothetical protein
MVPLVELSLTTLPSALGPGDHEAERRSTLTQLANAKVTPLRAVLRYRDLLKVEDLFLRTKAVMRTRPILHSSDAAIREHAFCSCLALAMHLEDLLRKSGIVPEWKALLRDLDRLQHVRIYHRYRDWLVPTDVAKPIAESFRHTHIALPPRATQMAPPEARSTDKICAQAAWLPQT